MELHHLTQSVKLFLRQPLAPLHIALKGFSLIAKIDTSTNGNRPLLLSFPLLRNLVPKSLPRTSYPNTSTGRPIRIPTKASAEARLELRRRSHRPPDARTSQCARSGWQPLSMGTSERGA